MEKMKLNSRIRYNKARVRNGYGPHRILKMIQENLRESLTENTIKEEVIE
jgi:hypothetical protein